MIAIILPESLNNYRVIRHQRADGTIVYEVIEAKKKLGGAVTLGEVLDVLGTPAGRMFSFNEDRR